MRIVFATEAQCADIARIEEACFSKPWSCEELAKSLEYGTRLAVAEVDGKIVGYVGVQLTPDGGYITNVAVLPEYRRQGIAKALLKRLFTVISGNGLSFLSLEVRKSNFAAQALYESLDFNVLGVRRGFYSDPKEDALIMTKYFKLVVRE